MDILKKYNQENPEVPQPHVSQYNSFENYSFLMRMVVRLSGGKIQDARQITLLLIGVVVAVFLLTFLIITQHINLLPVKRFSPEESRRQLEEYKKIQSF